jgi:hypothetical protein
MRFGKNSLAAVAMATLALAPIAAQAQSTPVEASQIERAGADRENESKIGGVSVFLAILALAAIAAGIVLAVGNNNDDATSPG